MPLLGTMHRQQQELPPMHQSRGYGQYIDSNPSSTHSSPRSFAPDLEPYYPTPTSQALHSQTYPIPAGVHANPYPSAQQRRPNHHLQMSRSNSYSSYTSPMSLQVSTSTSSVQEHDPNERTARPGNAHAHAQFHSSLSAHLAPLANAASSSTAPSAPTNSDIARTNPEGDNVNPSGGAPTDYTSSTPGLSAGLTRPLQPIEQERLAHLDRLKFFLATAPSRWDSAASNAAPPGSNGGDLSTAFASGSTPFSGISGLGIEPAYHHAPPHPSLNRFLLPNQEFVTCVLWNGLYHITGTDIVRALVFRFEAFGRPVRNMKKFEEGVFSDLRNLKPGVDACLEEPKSPFLDLLFKYQCIRTQKKQKVFYWFSVPHDRLFLDALERDLKREKMGQEPTSQIVGEPALSFSYDSKRSLYEQFSKAQGAREGEGELEAAVRRAEEGDAGDISEGGDGDSSMADDSASDADDAMAGDDDGGVRRKHPAVGPNGQQVFQLFSLFEGSPTYKQRRKKSAKASGLRKGGEDYPDDYGRGRNMRPASSGRYSSASHSRERSGLSMHIHSSILDEFGANGQEPQGETLSAAETFRRQARGESVPADGIVRKQKPQPIVGEVGAYYNEAIDGQAAHQQFAIGVGHSRGRSFDGQTGQAPQDPGSSPQPAGYNAAFTDSQSQGQVGQGQKFIGPPPTATGMAQYEAMSADGKVRVFVCPLFSCGRLFKRMEHLKRHLRTHTMERPFSCPQCKKRFSRSDNLSQHLRTHERVGSGSISSGVGGGSPEEWMDGGDEGDASGEASANEGSGHGSVGDSEDDEGMMQGMHSFGGNLGELGMFGNVNGLSMNGLDLSPYGINLDAQMCEIELPGGVRDVPGDEEGLLMRTEGGFDSTMAYRQHPAQMPVSASESYFSSLPPSANSGLLFSGISGTSVSTDYTDPQWSARTQPTRPSATGSPSGFLRNMQPHHSHSSSSSASSAYGDDYSAPSLSAPSHKQTFDHPGLYQHGMLDNTNPSSVGPTRRHRSMTPSLVRNGEPIRRPVTAGSGDFQGGGSPNSIASIGSSGAGRGYHPYAYSASNSRAGSTANSPLTHPIPLTGEYSQQIRRSDSRGSNYGGGVGGLHEQMRNMMSVNMDPDSHPSVASNVFNDGVFRSDSPASFHQGQSPAPFSVDLPMQYAGTASYIPPTSQHQHQIHAASLPVQTTTSYESSPHQQHYDPYYPQPHSTI